MLELDVDFATYFVGNTVRVAVCEGALRNEGRIHELSTDVLTVVVAQNRVEFPAQFAAVGRWRECNAAEVRVGVGAGEAVLVRLHVVITLKRQGRVLVRLDRGADVKDM